MITNNQYDSIAINLIMILMAFSISFLLAVLLSLLFLALLYKDFLPLGKVKY